MTTATRADNPLTQFAWTPQPEAERLIGELVQELFARLLEARQFADRLHVDAGVRFHDVIDHVELHDWSRFAERLTGAGYAEAPSRASESGPRFWPSFAQRPARNRVFVHGGGIFPPVVLRDGGEYAGHIVVAIKVDSVANFAAAHRLLLDEGGPLVPFRRVNLESRGTATLDAVERHGVAGFVDPPFPTPEFQVNVARHAERFRVRKRTCDRDENFFDWADAILATAISEVGRDWACDLFFAAEREYWMRRNRAAQVQYARQQRLGLGWANHDHHTYRSSREHFTRLIAIWEKLGFVCRERFYAGAEAGWGAQVMEHPVCGIVTFNDVDLSPDELMTDFAHDPLPPRKELGTVGLWCALHGESFLEAGMHHLECTFDFDALKRQLESEHAIKVMKPFTDLPHLKQAFTEGERWPVRPERIEWLLRDGRITPEQAEKFRAEGAIGSHLENLERNAGFKGFNQKGVSEIIAATDPRRQ